MKKGLIFLCLLTFLYGCSKNEKKTDINPSSQDIDNGLLEIDPSDLPETAKLMQNISDTLAKYSINSMYLPEEEDGKYIVYISIQPIESMSDEDLINQIQEELKDFDVQFKISIEDIETGAFIETVD